ncbi:ATP-binding protein [Omnitrophica bacterium]|nr:ATP-binding protein [Candidatus Omnitrophota bacterium]
MFLYHHTLLALFITSATCLALGVFVFLQRIKREIRYTFFLYSLSLSVWSFGEAYAIYHDNYYISLLAVKLCHVGVVFLPIFFIHLILSILDITTAKRWIVRTIYPIGFFFVCFLPTSLLVKSVSYYPPHFKYIFVPGILYIPMLSFWACLIVYAFVLLLSGYRTSAGSKKLQLKFFFYGLLLSYLGGVPNFLFGFRILVPVLMPFGTYFLPLYVGITAYAIIRHNLMDITVIIKKTLVFAGLLTMVMGIVATMTLVTQELLGKFVRISPAISGMLAAMVAIVLYEPTKALLVRATDKYLFQKKEDFKVVLNRLARNIISILDIEEVGKTILSTLRMALRIESGAILIKDENESEFKVHDSFGIEDRELVVHKDDIFLKILHSAEGIIKAETSEEKDAVPAGVRDILNRLNAVIVIPLYLHMDLIGIMTLGKKRSDQEYSQEEIDYFPTVASQVAVSLSNARLYDLLKKSQIDFAQQAKMAAIGTLSAGISHEIKNPLNHIKVGIAMLRMNRKHGIFEQMDRFKMENEIYKTLDILDENVTRANAVIERLSSFAKKPKELKIEPVDLSKTIDMALAFVENEFKKHGIEVQKEFPPDPPMVKGDLHTFEDVFLNLLVNARHAMGEHGRLTIKGVIQNGAYDIMIRDTGQGIDKDNLARIFDPFFTTKDVSRNPDKEAIKGSGLGLFIVREFIQRFGGQIKVESEVGQGTTFHVIFPQETWVRASSEKV